MFEATKERLMPITGLGGRIEPAASLRELMSRNRLPQVMPAAFVVPMALRGGKADAVTIYRQNVTEVLSIILFLRSLNDATGAKAADDLTPLRNDVIRRLCGWEPPSHWGDRETIGPLTLARGELITLSASALVYQLDFAFDDQMRF